MSSFVVQTPASLSSDHSLIREYFIFILHILDQKRMTNIARNEDKNMVLSAELLLNYINSRKNTKLKTPREIFINTFFEVDTLNGKIYCKKSRIGGQYKVGEEIKGSKKAGYIKIWVNDYKTGIAISTLPRSHIIWWKHTGKWPVGLIDHINRIKDDDSINNLRDVTHSVNSLNNGKINKLPPYIRCVKRKNGVKYKYSKYFNGRLLTTSTYLTIEDAINKGKRNWEKRVQNLHKDLI